MESSDKTCLHQTVGITHLRVLALRWATRNTGARRGTDYASTPVCLLCSWFDGSHADSICGAHPPAVEPAPRDADCVWSEFCNAVQKVVMQKHERVPVPPKFAGARGVWPRPRCDCPTCGREMSLAWGSKRGPYLRHLPQRGAEKLACHGFKNYAIPAPVEAQRDLPKKASMHITRMHDGGIDRYPAISTSPCVRNGRKRRPRPRPERRLACRAGESGAAPEPHRPRPDAERYVHTVRDLMVPMGDIEVGIGASSMRREGVFGRIGSREAPSAAATR